MTRPAPFPLLGLLTLAALAACGGPAPGASTLAPAPAPANTGSGGSAASYLRKVKFKAADAAGSFSIKVRADGAKLVDADEQEIARIRVEPDGRIKFKDSADQPLGSIHGAAPQWHLKDAAGGAVLLQLVRQDDGDLKVEDGAGALRFRVKLRDYGAEVETPDDRSLFKAKHKDNGLSIRDAGDRTVLHTNDARGDQGDAQAAALLVLPDLTLPQRAALWYAVEQSRAPTNNR